MTVTRQSLSWKVLNKIWRSPLKHWSRVITPPLTCHLMIWPGISFGQELPPTGSFECIFDRMTVPISNYLLSCLCRAVQCSTPSFTFSHHTITFAEVVDFPRIGFGLGLGSGTFAFELHGFSRCRVVINIDCFLELFSPCRDRLLFVRFKVTLALMVVISPLSPQASTLFTIHVTHKTARPSLGQRHRPEIHTITWRYLLVFSVSLAFLLLPIICVPFSCFKQSLSGWWISKSFCSFHLSSRKCTNRPHRIMHTSKFSCVKAP
jgi:hypothetical protein